MMEFTSHAEVIEIGLKQSTLLLPKRLPALKNGTVPLLSPIFQVLVTSGGASIPPSGHLVQEAIGAAIRRGEPAAMGAWVCPVPVPREDLPTADEGPCNTITPTEGGVSRKTKLAVSQVVESPIMPATVTSNRHQ